MTTTTLISVPAQGPRGPKGDQGDQGDVGLRGIAGPIGQKGLTGEKGLDGAGYTATSETVVDLTDSGTIILTTQTNLAYTVGSRIRVSSRGNVGFLMEGTVTDYTSVGGILTAIMDLKVGGSLTADDWNINLAGIPGSLAGVTLGTIASQNANNVIITGGSIIGQADPTVSSGVATKNYVDASTTAGVPAVRLVNTGGLLTGGGNLGADRTITLTAATQAEAQVGTDNTKAMTPLRTNQAIAQLQLFKEVASQAEAQAGAENSKGMTALRTAQAISALVPPMIPPAPPTGFTSAIFGLVNYGFGQVGMDISNVQQVGQYALLRNGGSPIGNGGASGGPFTALIYSDGTGFGSGGGVGGVWRNMSGDTISGGQGGLFMRVG